jgi:hypothetical protein
MGELRSEKEDINNLHFLAYVMEKKIRNTRWAGSLGNPEKENHT